jgi:hypothetical protein
MAYNGKPFFKIPRPLLLAGGFEAKTIADGHTLTDKDSLFQSINGGGSDRNIVMPAEKDGRVYCIKNAGASHDLDVQNDSAVPLVKLSPKEVAVLVSSGTDWHVMINVTNH